ncbi:uncharacterized protein GJ701_005861 isoform 3-T3 [Geothlypis trichas]
MLPGTAATRAQGSRGSAALSRCSARRADVPWMCSKTDRTRGGRGGDPPGQAHRWSNSCRGRPGTQPFSSESRSCTRRTISCLAFSGKLPSWKAAGEGSAEPFSAVRKWLRSSRREQPRLAAAEVTDAALNTLLCSIPAESGLPLPPYQGRDRHLLSPARPGAPSTGSSPGASAAPAGRSLRLPAAAASLPALPSF